MAITEFTFSVDDFESPKEYKDAKAIMLLLTRLLLLEPGTIQSHPDAGVGLHSKYRFAVEGSASDLEADFRRQIEKYLPQFQGAKVNCKESNGTLQIVVEIDDTLYGIYYDVNTSELKSGYTKLTDL
jgi:hypothetical protein